MEYKSWETIKIFLAQDNFLEGSLPNEYAVPPSHWRTLMNFNIARNRFSGELPTAFSQLRQLVSFDVSGNQFGGPVRPVGAGNLKFFGAAFNNLSGSIPLDEAGSPTFFPGVLDLRGNFHLHALVQPVLGPHEGCGSAPSLRADPRAFVPVHIVD